MTDNFDMYRSQQDASMEFYRLRKENARLQSIVEKQRSALEQILHDFDGNGADLMSEVAENALKEQPK